MVPKKKTPQMTVGTRYWQRSSGAWKLHEVTSSSGGTRELSRRMTKKEASVFVDGWNSSSPRKKKIRDP